MQWAWIVLNCAKDGRASTFTLSDPEKVPPQQAELIMKRNFQGVYTEKTISVIILSHSQTPRLLV